MPMPEWSVLIHHCWWCRGTGTSTPLCSYRDTYCTNKTWRNKTFALLLFSWVPKSHNLWFGLCISHAVSILGAAFLVISLKNYLCCSTRVHAVPPICSPALAGLLKYNSAKALGVPHHLDLCFPSTEMDRSVESRDFLGIERDVESWTLKSLEAASGQYKNINFNWEFHVQITWKHRACWKEICWTWMYFLWPR